MDLRRRRVLVMGLGVHGGGLGVVRYLVSRGAEVVVTDLRAAGDLQGTLDQLQGLPVRYVLGKHREEDFRWAEMVVRNPAVPLESPYLAVARAAGAAIEMEVTLFLRECPALVAGITGTKGKSTTTALAGAMLVRLDPDTVVAGNLRVSALEALPRIGPETPVVLELSSWQTEGLGACGLSPGIAAVTNISPDHLNRYSGLDAYIEAKRLIYRQQRRDDTLVLNRDDPVVRSFARDAPGRVLWFSLYRLSPGADGAWLEGGWLRRREDGREDTVCAAAEVRLPGRHNLANTLAAVCVAGARGASLQHLREGIRTFAGLPDRMERLGTVEGVAFYNDTTSTAPAATIAALESSTTPVVLIAGGAAKGTGFEALGEAIAARTKAVVLLEGSATEALSQAIERAHGRVAARGDSLRQAFVAARELAEPGDSIVLSPGCASFGMFANEFDRGEQFRALFREVAGE